MLGLRPTINNFHFIMYNYKLNYLVHPKIILKKFKHLVKLIFFNLIPKLEKHVLKISL